MTVHKALQGSVLDKTLQDMLALCCSTQLFSKNLGTFLSFPREVEVNKKLLKNTFFPEVLLIRPHPAVPAGSRLSGASSQAGRAPGTGRGRKHRLHGSGQTAPELL